MSWCSNGPIVTVNVRITASDYVDILVYQMHPIIQLFFKKMMQFFKLKFAHTHSQECFVGLRSMKIHFNIFPVQHNRQT